MKIAFSFSFFSEKKKIIIKKKNNRLNLSLTLHTSTLGLHGLEFRHDKKRPSRSALFKVLLWAAQRPAQLIRNRRPASASSAANQFVQFCPYQYACSAARCWEPSTHRKVTRNHDSPDGEKESIVPENTRRG
ncbi:uncharacterized protein TrAtP1_000928 [Trichoderma atroviride]|uniref:uncharacterized protein n=1 Tax=Hypocrea atroviridis TaxID=63577 RepID=UPI00331F70B4|nr:hypothetical protein TrAtP1_000928 [Trichoderma atroviride]